MSAAPHVITLAELGTPVWVAFVVLAVLLGVGAGVLLLRAVTGQTVAKARTEADQIKRLAESESQTLRERAEIDAQKRTIAERERVESELQKQRDDLREQERRLAKREDQHERKLEALSLKEQSLDDRKASLDDRAAGLDEREKEIDELTEQKKQELLRVTDMTPEQAREELLATIEDDAREDAAAIVRKHHEEAVEKSRSEAQEIILHAVQRYAGEFAAESTVRSIPIPSDDIKGRVIGREGRNIRAIQQATGVDLIVDDTPGVIVVSCFDKVRQTIAAEALMKLIDDGRIHPSRIEEVVNQVQKDVEDRITTYGKEAVDELKLRKVHPKVADAMGRLAFRTSYGQNILRHSVEVAYISQIIADQLGLKGTIARRCGFLHDIGKAMDHEMEGTHPRIGMDFAKQFGEKEPVLNAIAGHHGDVPATSFYTPIVMAADALSGARPGARRESLERYIQRLEQLQDIALSFKGVGEAHAIQAGREVRVMVDAKHVSDDEAHFIAKKIADRVSDEMTFPGEIKVTVLRETRAVEVAR